MKKTLAIALLILVAALAGLYLTGLSADSPRMVAAAPAAAPPAPADIASDDSARAVPAAAASDDGVEREQTTADTRGACGREVRCTNRDCETCPLNPNARR
jgi:hypothetical protein